MSSDPEGTPEAPRPGTAPAAPPLSAGQTRVPKAPGLAAILSLFPGIGQIYNGQPAKALVFFASFAGAIYATAEINPLPFALLIPFVYFYNLVDAYRSALIVNAKAAGGVLPEDDSAESPAWGGSLIGLGLLFLLNNLGWLDLARLNRFWPLLLIVAGAAFLYGSLQKRKDGGDAGRV